jgi:hypothetical protein
MELHTVRNTMLFVFRISSSALQLLPYYFFYLGNVLLLFFRIGSWALLEVAGFLF